MNNIHFLLRQVKHNFKLTYLILLVNVFIWIVMTIAGGSTNALVLLKFGATERTLVLHGEVWRMISSAFLHIGIFHLLINSFTLYQLGNFVEEFFGRTKFIATYILTAITASTLSIVLTDSISAGASGALFGLIGLILGNSWAKKTYVPDLPIDEKSLIPFVIFNLWYGMVTPGINNWAHIGGLVGGILLGYIFDPALSFDPSALKRILPQILAKLSVILLALTIVFWILSVFGYNVLLFS